MIYFHLYHDKPHYLALDNYGSVKVSNIVSVHDGDTFSVNINKWPAIVGENISIRIRNIDTPEITSKNIKIRFLATAAKNELIKLLESGSVKLINIKRDKYFRINADVTVGKKDIGFTLMSMGLAKEYDGETKTDWTESDYNNYMNVLNSR